MRFLIALFALLSLPAAAIGDEPHDPSLKVINFTADWCPNCQVLNPRMDEAIARFDAGSIERVDLDMTGASRRAGEIDRANTIADAIRTATAHQVGYLWDWYGGITGIAAVVAADNGEPITCFNRALSTEEIADRLRLAKIIAERAPQGARKPDGPDCPPPLR